MSTGVRLQAAGWKITDVPVVVARRLAPWTDDRHLHRWARDLHERLSVLVDREAPRRNEFATRLRRRVYRAADLHVGRGIQRLVLVGILFTVLYTSSLPLVADAMVLIPLWGSWQLSSWLYRYNAQKPIGFTHSISNDLRLLPTDLYVAFRALPGRPLGLDLSDPAPGRLARMIFLIGLQFALAVSLAVFGLGILRPSHDDFAILATLGITAWLWAMTFQAQAALRLHQKRQNFRAGDELRVLASKDRMAVIGVSPFGIDVVSATPLRMGETVRLAFALPQVDGSSIRFDCPTAVRRCTHTRGAYVSYLRFAQLSDIEVDQITEYTAVVAGAHGLRDNLEGRSDFDVPIEATLVKPRAGTAEVAEV